jgi:hypothetical protein
MSEVAHVAVVVAHRVDGGMLGTMHKDGPAGCNLSGDLDLTNFEESINEQQLRPRSPSGDFRFAWGWVGGRRRRDKKSVAGH